MNAGFIWHEISLGLILGCNLIKFKLPNGKSDISKKRLYSILISETAYIIWKIWCEWKISHESDPNKELSQPKVLNKWLDTIQKRITLDYILTNKHKYKNKVLKYSLIKNTWSLIIGLN